MTEEKKKGFFSRLFGTGKSSCCSVQIVEELEKDTQADDDEDQRKNGETG